METLIKAIEVWAPGHEAMTLEILTGSYVHLPIKPKQRAERAILKFAYGEGVFGRAWANKSPEITKPGAELNAIAGDLVSEAGVTACVAMPLFAGDYLMAMLVFLLAGDNDQVGAIEHWQCDALNSHDLKLNSGVFSNLEHFEFIAKHTSFRKGIGLPGGVWQSGSPMVIENLAQSRIFVRSQGAAQAGVSSGFAIPCAGSGGQVNVLAFLSSSSTPMVRQVEVWGQAGASDNFVFREGYTCLGLPLAEFYQDSQVTRGSGMLGRVLLSGRPELSENPEDFYFSDISSERDLSLNCKLVFPLMQNGLCVNLVVLYF